MVIEARPSNIQQVWEKASTGNAVFMNQSYLGVHSDPGPKLEIVQPPKHSWIQVV